MTWARLDDQFPNHPKIVAAGPLAGWLHVCGICYCNSQLTDGFIPSGMVRRLADVPNLDALVDALVTIGLWGVTDGGYEIHDYLEYNPSSEKIKEQRKQTAQRQARWKEGKGKQTPNASTNASANAVTNAAPPHPIPVLALDKSNAAAPPPKPVSAKQRRVAEVAVAFAAAGAKFPRMVDGDSKALLALLDAGWTPEQIAECWRDVKEGHYGDEFAKGQLSFQFLAGFNRLGNWLDWVESGRPDPEPHTGGKAPMSTPYTYAEPAR